MERAFAQSNFAPYFVPDFDDWPGYLDGFIDESPDIQGALGWKSAWPAADAGIANASDATDLNILEQAHSADKVYKMRKLHSSLAFQSVIDLKAAWSSFQFKDLDIGHYYRIGEVNSAQHICQLLSAKPDDVELITWNDSDEGHSIGNNWPEQDPAEYSNGYNHTAWQTLLPLVMTGLRNGVNDPAALAPAASNAVAEGAVWY